MILDYVTLRLVWWLLIGILLIGFAIADGMDMGVGTLLPFLGKTDSERRVIINTVGPHWEGNQVWFVTAGGAIFAAWPTVYATAFSGFYLAMLLVLVALFFRPVGFDYRSKLDDPRWRDAWDWCLFAGSVVPALVFGIAFGNLLQGVPFHLDRFMKPHFDAPFIWALLPLFNPFALFCGLISVGMLVLHGAVWLQLRTEGVIAARAKAVIQIAAPLVSIAFALAGIWVAYGIDGYRVVSRPPLESLSNPLGKQVVREAGAWFSAYRAHTLTMLAPLLGLAGPLLALMASRAGRTGLAFVASGLAVAGIIATAGISMFPFIMPSSSNPGSSLTVWDATSSHLTLSVMLWVVIILLPIVLGYTIWCYTRMWGKVTVADIEDRAHSTY